MIIRPATETDRFAISRLLRPRDYNRIHLQPTCFLVAEDQGVVIGIGQVKRHREGSAELASLVVAPNRRGEGIGRALVRALVARYYAQNQKAQNQEPLYLFCLAELESFYASVGFTRVAPRQLPPWLALLQGVGNGVGYLGWLVQGRRLRVLTMKTVGCSEK
ncbi:MAG: GNAT family N-acetyltransferase [Caldilineaceae bacterium]|nr:GNAT family N-acetyltransferase [Caldilineaceae bacterium]